MKKIGNKLFADVTSIELLSKKLNSKVGWIQVWYSGGDKYEEIYFKTPEEAEEEFKRIPL